MAYSFKYRVEPLRAEEPRQHRLFADTPSLRIDSARMDRALASERIAVPDGLSDQELHQFILDVAAGKK
jgi:hypothetical protein